MKCLWQLVLETSLWQRQSASSLGDVALTRFQFWPPWTNHCLYFDPHVSVWIQIPHRLQVQLRLGFSPMERLIPKSLPQTWWDFFATDLVKMLMTLVLLLQSWWSICFSGESSWAWSHLPGLVGHHLPEVGQGGQHLGEGHNEPGHPDHHHHDYDDHAEHHLTITIDNLQTAELAAQLDKDLPSGSPVVMSWPKYGEYCYDSLGDSAWAKIWWILKWWQYCTVLGLIIVIVCLSRRNSGCQVQRGGDQGDGKVGEWWFKSETCQRIKEMDMLPMIRVNTETLKAVVKCNEFIFCWELKPFPNWIVHLKLWISKICKDVRESWGDRLSPGSCPSKSQLVARFLQPEHVSLEILLFQASWKFDCQTI